MEWYNPGLIEGIEEMPELSQDRIFLFKAVDGQGGAATTNEEITSWIQSMLPPLEHATHAKEFKYDDYCVNASNSQNENVRLGLANELKLLESFMAS